ncbi:hypothetical protein [Maribacter aurantiacus]|uniref:Carboxypeptidase regulatory-like domain-containing protein n=1 Tax=Maribacter aurantiacus TaxID=1882343 RepID=A0A5R8M4G8_9FLAO|nr:hypothetical protein [Maribacter aurantiacus]TLF44474.1 hypothetical protein FEK29_11730 [Maribacter aurantiacus]
MKITSFWFLCLVVMCGSTQAQYVVKSSGELESLIKLPQEKTYLDHTGPVVFSGEYLNYAFYCFNVQSNKLSEISKIGYVSLINESKEMVFEHKLNIENGLAHGDFFLTTNIPTGKYKLLAYTNWMKNGGLQQLYKDDIIIINPYISNPSFSSIFSNDKKLNNSKNDLIYKLDSSVISLKLPKESYGPREKVTLSIKNYKGLLGRGTYTIKVIKKNEIATKPVLSAIEYATQFSTAKNQVQPKIENYVFLPEQRGELFFGSISDSVTGIAIEDAPVLLSIPGEGFLFQFSKTDEDGLFFFYLKKGYNKGKAVIQVDEKFRSYTINKGKIKNLDFDNLNFQELNASKNYENIIKERSIQNQLENLFFEAKPDSILSDDNYETYYLGKPEVFYLDEYTRFPTFEETLLEVIKFAGYREGGSRSDYIKITQDVKIYKEALDNLPAIVLIDGVFILEHEKIKKFDASRIDKISLFRGQLSLGGKIYHGILSIDTLDENFLEYYNIKNGLVTDLVKPFPVKNYYKQKYDGDNPNISRIPDYRRLLFWQPHLKINSEIIDLEFFTSDIEGEFEISLNGFTTYGKPISNKISFEVLKDLSH